MGMIVVTGMHRSGTSMIAHLIGELGVPLGDPSNFLQTDRWNPRGYFEHRDVVDLNSLIVTGFEWTTGGIRGVLRQIVYSSRPSRRALGRRARRYAPEIARLSDKYADIALKDPRFCLTLRFWAKHSPPAGVIVCLRDPEEAVRSLRRRQNYPVTLGYRFWDYHMSSLIRQLDELRPIPRLYVSYNDLAAGADRDLRAISSFLGLGLSEGRLQQVYDSVFDPDLRHCRAAPTRQLPSRSQTLWQELLERREHRLAALADAVPAAGSRPGPPPTVVRAMPKGPDHE